LTIAPGLFSLPCFAFLYLMKCGQASQANQEAKREQWILEHRIANDVQALQTHTQQFTPQNPQTLNTRSVRVQSQL
jgi:hypothetical protein